MRTGSSNARHGAFGGAGTGNKLAPSRRRRRTFGRDPAALSTDVKLRKVASDPSHSNRRFLLTSSSSRQVLLAAKSSHLSMGGVLRRRYWRHQSGNHGPGAGTDHRDHFQDSG